MDVARCIAAGYERIVDDDRHQQPVTPAEDMGEGGRATPSVQGRELAAELRRIRLAAGLSRNEIAQEVGLPEPDLSRLETGQVIPSVGEVARWSHAVGASDRVKEQLRSLAVAVSKVTALPNWLGTDVVALQEELRQLEASSMSQRTCLVGLIPGLLQTREYAGMIMEFNALPKDDQDAAVNARLMRQAIIQDPRRRFEFILSEAGLRWSRPGTSRTVLRNQIRYIAELSELSNISIGVVRSGAQTKVPFIQSYYIYEDASLPGSKETVDLVVLETPPAAIVISDPMAVRGYRRDLSWLREAAEFGADAVNRIGRSGR
jgi:transcriptional regulator with XRE-family HTH domain